MVGKSGSGKSTVALAVMGLLPSEAQVAAGRILYPGQQRAGAVARSPPSPARRTHGCGVPGSVLGAQPVNANCEQVGEGLVYHKGFSKMAAVARATQLLHEVGIAEAAAVGNAYPHELSGGMRQRALIAGALAAEPDFLILDEPTTALDVTIEAQILDLLEELQSRRGLSMLFISHNLGVVRRIADEVAVLYAGEVVESGPTAEVFERPFHPYTKGLLAAIPRLDAGQARLAAIPGRLPDLRQLPAGCRFERRCPFAQPPCREPQRLRGTGDARAVRCFRAAELATRHGRDGWAACRSAAPHVGRQLRWLRPDEAHQDLYLEPWPRRSRPSRAGDPRLGAVRVRAVDGVTLTIRRGEVLGLVGEFGFWQDHVGPRHPAPRQSRRRQRSTLPA